jgi:hypothetical protein
MPALPPIANVLRLAISGTVGTHNWVNILHFLWSGSPPTVPSLGTWNNDVVTSWTALVTPLQDTESTLTGVLSTDLTSSSGAQVETAADVPGTRAGGQLPANACCLVDYPVSVRYRGGHPRTYLNIGVEADLDTPSTWGDSFVAAVVSAWEGFLGSITDTTIDGMVLGAVGTVSYRHALAPRPEPIFLVYTGGGLTVQKELASQRRRIGRK